MKRIWRTALGAGSEGHDLGASVSSKRARSGSARDRTRSAALMAARAERGRSNARVDAGVKVHTLEAFLGMVDPNNEDSQGCVVQCRDEGSAARMRSAIRRYQRGQGGIHGAGALRRALVAAEAAAIERERDLARGEQRRARLNLYLARLQLMAQAQLSLELGLAVDREIMRITVRRRSHQMEANLIQG